MLSRYLLISIFCLCVTVPALAQLPDGSTAPDFTVTDIDGNTHHLYEILESGKSVVLDFSAVWCSICWNYHNSHALNDFYMQYGPDGSNEAMVLFLESDLTTGVDAINGIGGGTQGDWTDGTLYPIVDLPNHEIRTAYDVPGYPTIYKICPDKKVYELFQPSAKELGFWLQSCQLDIELNDVTNTSCHGLGEGAVSVNVTGGFGPIEYAWSNGTTADILTDVEAGTYHVTVSDLNDRTAVLEDIVITGPNTPVEITSADITDLQCYDDWSGRIDLQAGGGTPSYNYYWDFGQVGNMVPFLSAGSYTVTVTDANGCSVVATYEVSEPDSLMISPVVTDADCGAPFGMLDYNISGGIPPYMTWLNGLPMGTTNGTSQIESLLPSGYNFLITDANGCESSVDFVIESSPELIVDLGQDTSLTCAQLDVQLTAQVSGSIGDLSITWETSGGNIIALDQLSVEVDHPETYIVSIWDFSTMCLAIDTVHVTDMRELPIAGYMSVSNGLQVNFENNSAGVNLDYLWDFGDGTTSTAQSPEHAYCCTGIYSVCLISTNFCGSDTICRDVSVSEYPKGDLPQWSSDVERVKVEAGSVNQPRIIVHDASPSDSFRYTLVNVNGAEITGGEFMGATHQLSISKSIPAGIYLLVVRDEHGLVHTYKLSLF